MLTAELLSQVDYWHYALNALLEQKRRKEKHRFWEEWSNPLRLLALRYHVMQHHVSNNKNNIISTGLKLSKDCILSDSYFSNPQGVTMIIPVNIFVVTTPF